MGKTNNEPRMKACRQPSEEKEQGLGWDLQRGGMGVGQRSVSRGRSDLLRGNDEQLSLGHTMEAGDIAKGRACKGCVRPSVSLLAPQK